ncbi:MAG TPA: glutamate--tRNA ligase [Actinomycetota bacterium]|nr:glutamate--tRNA ligase [Actinomycetota bacterium]
MQVRTRLEPAPSGSIHVGNARTGLFNWMFARHHDGAFVLRIADTDAARATEENYQAVLADLKWLGLHWDEGPDIGGPHGPYRQSERHELHRDWARKLIDAGFAYEDRSTAEEVDVERKRAQSEGRRPDHRALAERAAGNGGPASVRFAVPMDRTITFHDEVLGEVSTDLGRTPDFVILRADGSPTYMLAVTVDDVAMEISHIIRGNDLVASTARQLLLREAMGVEQMPVFAHLPLIVDDKGKPLSKRWGDVSVRAYRDQGFLPEAMLNYLALLGWSLDDHTNIFPIDEAIAAFDLGRVNRNPAAFDVTKLEWVNGHYIRAKSPNEVAEDLVPFCVAEGLPADSDEGRAILARVAPLLTERMKRLTEAPPMIRFLFEDVSPDTKAAKVLEGQGDYLTEVADALGAIEKWTVAEIEGALRALAERRELKPKQAFQPIRAAVTGTLVSPPLFESLEVLGKDKTLERIRRAS